MPSFYEFFAGGGMARAGLGKKWTCLLANEIDEKKGASYAANWGSDHLKIDDVGRLTTADLPGRADLAWASFPCQDLSLAGDYAGLKGKRSGTFWLFWKGIQALNAEDRAPSIIALENVCGALTSHDGKDFAAICAALANESYVFGALVIDAAHFVPQSRPRLFVVALRQERSIPERLTSDGPDPRWHSSNLIAAYGKLAEPLKASWKWWRLPAPPPRKLNLAGIIDDEPSHVTLHDPAQTQRLLEMMSPLHRNKVEQAKRQGRRIIGGVYKRTRRDAQGRRLQRAEVRFDNVAGCLRTPAGGSSRQTIIMIDGDDIKTRLLAPREAARLMGLPDTYTLPENYNDAYHLAGDGVVVPVVRFLAAHLIEPLLAGGSGQEEVAAA